MIALLARFAPSLLPGLTGLLNPWLLLIVVAAGGVLWWHGYATGRDKLDDYLAAQATAAVQIVTRQGRVTERVVTRYVERAGKTEVVIKEVEKGVTHYAAANPDGLCLDGDWRVLHDAAAAGVVPRGPAAPAGGLRAPGSAPGGLRFPYRSPGAGGSDRELREASPLRRPAGWVAALGE